MALFKEQKIKYGFFNCKQSKEDPKASINLLRELGVDLVVLKGTTDSGHTPKYAGYKDLKEKCIEHNKKLFKNHEVIVSNCPHCIEIFKKEYNIKAKHFFEILQENAHKIRSINGIKIDYQHACYLNKIGISKKNVENFLKKIGFLIEKSFDECCGSVAEDFERNFPSLANNVCQKNIKTDSLIISLCPFSVSMMKKNGLKATELGDLLNEI